MAYDSFRERPKHKGLQIVVAVCALLGGLTSTAVNGFSFSKQFKPLHANNDENCATRENNNSCPFVKPWVRYSVIGVVYPWQLLWITYGLGQLVCSVSSTSVSWKTFLIFVLASIWDVLLVFMKDAEKGGLALAFSLLLVVTLFNAVGVEAFHLYKLALDVNVVSRWFSWIIVLNGLTAYATWASVEAVYNTYVMTINVDQHSSTASVGMTVTMSFLIGVLILYLVLENTLLDRYLRGNLVVYPLMIWIAGGLFDEQKGSLPQRNGYVSIGLLVIAVVCFALRCILQTVFWIVRPLPRYKRNYYLS